MPTPKTKVINHTGSDVFLNWSNLGVTSELRVEPLKHGCHHLISLDLTTTDLEIWCSVQSNRQHKVIFSSDDDCAKYSEITLIPDYVTNDAGQRVISKYTWKGTRIRGSARTTKKAPEHDSSDAPGTSAIGASPDAGDPVRSARATADKRNCWIL